MQKFALTAEISTIVAGATFLCSPGPRSAPAPTLDYEYGYLYLRLPLVIDGTQDKLSAA